MYAGDDHSLQTRLLNTRMIAITLVRVYMGALLLVACAACRSDPAEPDTSNPSTAMEIRVATTYASIAYATYDDALIRARALRTAIAELVEAPTDETMSAARQAYIDARLPYEQSEALRFSGGPIDDYNRLEDLINGWPMWSVYIDFVSPDTSMGIVNDVENYPDLSKDYLKVLNKYISDEFICTGYHAIEYMLWGTDLSPTTAGMRSYTDYVISAEEPRLHAARRGQYLVAVVDMLVDHLTRVQTEWSPDGAHRKTFIANARKSLYQVLMGVQRFAIDELALKQMSVPKTTHLEDREQSNHSDQTHMDIVLSQKGIANVLLGRYTRIDGTGITGDSFVDLVAQTDTSVAATIRERVALATEACGKIRAPFDGEIKSLDGRSRIQTAIDAVNAEAGIMTEIRRALGPSVLN